MNSSVLLLFLLTVSIAGIFSLPSVFAEEDQTVRIPIGASLPSCADDDTCYVPSEIQINEGNRVEWVNDDSVAHTVTSGIPKEGHDGFFDSGIMAPRGEFEFTFDGFETGTYPYYCIAHPWMTGSVIMVDNTIDVTDNDESDDNTQYDFDSSIDDVYERDSDVNISKETHSNSEVLPNQRIFGKYKVTVDWIRELPVTNEVNGIEILVSHTVKKSSHGESMKEMKSQGENKGKHGESSHENKGKHGESSHENKGKHGESSHENKGKHGESKDKHSSGGGCGDSAHADKGMKSHEGGCPHFQMIQKMIPEIELLEKGISQVDRSMKITLSVGNRELIMPLDADENLPGRYTVVFIPTVAGKYGVEVHGTIHGSPVNMMIELDRVLDKNQITRFP